MRAQRATPICALLCIFYLSSSLAQLVGPPAPAHSPTPALLVSQQDWNGLVNPATGLPVVPGSLQVPPGIIEIELQLTGPDAFATPDTMDTMGSVLAETLPVTLDNTKPIAYKNVTTCEAPPESAPPAVAPNGRRMLSTTASTARRLRRQLMAETMAAPPPAPPCEPQMRAVFFLLFPLDINASYGQSLVRDLVQSGSYVARLKRRKLDVNRADLLTYVVGGEPPSTAYISSLGSEGAAAPFTEGDKTAVVNLAPAPSFDAAAQEAVMHPPANASAVNVFFTLVLSGVDALETNSECLTALTKLLTDTLNTGEVDYLTPENTAVIDVQQLPALVIPEGRRRSLLQLPAAWRGGGGPSAERDLVFFNDGTDGASLSRRGHPKIVGSSRGGAVGAMDGRPRKGQERSTGAPDTFALEVPGGNPNLKSQSVGEADADMGAPIHVSHRGMEHLRSEAMDVAGGLPNGQLRKGHVGGASAGDSMIVSDGPPRKGAHQGAFKAADWMLTRVGSIRIRAPGPGGNEGKMSSTAARGGQDEAESPSIFHEDLHQQHQKWGSNLASRTGELCNLLEGARTAGTRCLHRRSLQQLGRAFGRLGPPPVAFPAPAPAPAPEDNANSSTYQLTNLGPIQSVGVTYEVYAVPQPGPAVIADKLSYFIRTGQMVRLLQGEGHRIDYVQLARFSPLPGMPAPGGATAASESAGSSDVTKIAASVIIPVAVIAIGCAVMFAILFFRNKKRLMMSAQGSGERPVKDSAQSMHSARSSDKSGMRTSGSGSTTVRSMLDTLYSSRGGITGQEALALASLSKRSITLPGMGSDWEIDPDELEIARRPDGMEWELGSGASAKVYKATRHGVQTVAVKIFTDQVTAEHQARYAEAFRREIFILRSCHDRNIVQFIGACLQEGQTILVQEYLENGDLFHAIAEDTQSRRFGWYRQRLPSGRLAPNTGMARRIALDIARGLFFLHSRKIVHFDLKSANILLGRDWTAKIADVGLAKILKDGWLSTLREVGTFSWAAPEVLLGRPCTEKVDMYSFGVMLWELSAGEAPPGRHLRPLRVPEECPADVEAMIARCLDNDPDNRPSAREMVDFMVELPATLSREDSSGATPSVDAPSSGEGVGRVGGLPGEPPTHDELLTKGASLTPMTPKRPPAGMVLPNAFGLLSMQSFRRTNSGLKRSNSGLKSAPSGEPEPAAALEAKQEAKPPKGPKSVVTIPSPFKYLTSTSFKKQPPQPPPGVPTIVEPPEEELEAAVMESNKSMSAAAAAAAAVAVQQALQAGAADAVPELVVPPGGYPARGDGLKGGPRKSVHFSDDAGDVAAGGSRSGQQPAATPAAPSQATVPDQAAADVARAGRSAPAGQQREGGNAAQQRRPPSPFASPFADADAESECPAAEGKQARAQEPVSRAAAVSSPSAAPDDGAAQRPGATTPAGRQAPAVSSPLASGQGAIEEAAGATEPLAKASPAKVQPPLIRSPFQRDPEV